MRDIFDGVDLMTARDIVVNPVSARDGNEFVRRVHYSGKVATTSQFHLGVFIGGMLHGVMSFGQSMVKKNIIGLVSGTGWNDTLELNRLAFDDFLPRNSESRALSVAFRMIKKSYPNIEWVVSFADGCQCGDGAIYRAAGFILTGIKRNSTMWRLPTGEVIADIITRMTDKHGVKERIGFKLGESWHMYADRVGAKRLDGFQLRYIYFLNPAARFRLTVPEIPFSRIDEIGAGMYRGKKKASVPSEPVGTTDAVGGAAPTRTLQDNGQVLHG
jgi:hypothetical protein